MKNYFIILLILLLTNISLSFSQQRTSFRIAKVKYNGGGDWYANKTSLPNLIKFCNEQLKMNIEAEEDIVEVGSAALFEYPFVHLTGHGNIVFSQQEAENLRNYLVGGGFLHIDDNYGLDKFIRVEMKKVFPNLDFVELPLSHPIYQQKFKFDKGLPKVHEHDGKPPKGYGLIFEGKLVCFYTYECDLGNGWEDQSVYNDPEWLRQEALKMGANILSFALTSY
ncbi:MAG: DUF4159 domain-containing protein [Flammeovirgaceae bacterium]